LARNARELSLACPSLAPDAIDALRRYGLPGNVRELENILRTALLASRGEPIAASLLPIEAVPQSTAFTLPSSGINLEALERDVIQQALRRTQGNRTRAASLLGLTRDQVRYRLSKLASSE
jgi:DNA-binding NtrC family response regulator